MSAPSHHALIPWASAWPAFGRKPVMASSIPRDAELFTVRLHVDHGRVHGFHHFVLIECPGQPRITLLHTVQLTVRKEPRAFLGRAVKQPIEPRTMATVLHRRRKELEHFKQRHAGVLTDAVIARLERSIGAPPRQLDLEDLLGGYREARSSCA